MNPKIKEKLSCIVYGKMQVVGTYSEQTFDDLSKYKDTGTPCVTSVKVWHGDVIDCVEFVYDKQQYEKGKSPFFHGGKNGHMEEFTIEDDDFIQTIEGEYGQYPYSLEPSQQNKDLIIRLRFKTHKGIYSKWYGNSCGKGEKMKGTPFLIDAGAECILCALYGATWKGNLVLHNYIQAIGAYYMSYRDAMNLLEIDRKG